MARYYYCYGICKDIHYQEFACEQRDDCIYYHIDNMRRFWTNPDYQMFVPPVDRKCPYFVAKKKENKTIEFDSPFD